MTSPKGPIPHTDTLTSADQPNTLTHAPSQGDAQHTQTWQGPVNAPTPRIPPGFRLVKALGQGGMGQVFEVVDDRLDSTYALKLAHPGTLSPTARERFRQEAKAMVDLDHPHIARIYTYGEHQDVPYITMRYLRGGNLAAKCAELRTDIRLAVAMIRKIVSATAYLHDRGFVHRDLKPHNILLDELGEPYVSDFGLVKSVLATGDTEQNAIATVPDQPALTTHEAITPHLTATGAILGTRVYMAPEQATGNISAIGPKTDVWSLGIMLYEILTGVRPFQHSDSNELTRRIVMEPVAAPSLLVERFDPTLERIILQCLAKNPADRPTAQSLHDELAAWLAPKPPVKHNRGKQQMWGLMIAATLIGATFLGWALWQKPKPPTYTPTPSIDEQRQLLRDRIAAGEKVPLVDADGKLLVPLNFLFDADEIRPVSVGENCKIDYSSLAFAELLDDVGVPNYVFHAQVKCNRIGKRAGGGIYLDHRTFTGEGMTSHVTNELRYADPIPATNTPIGPKADLAKKAVFTTVNKNAPKAISGLREAFVRRITLPESGGMAKFARDVVDVAELRSPNDDPSPDGWRPLAIHAKTTAFEYHWHNSKIARVARPIPMIMQERLMMKLPHLVNRDFVFNQPGGGIGLIIQDGSVSFSDVWIQRIDHD